MQQRQGEQDSNRSFKQAIRQLISQIEEAKQLRQLAIRNAEAAIHRLTAAALDKLALSERLTSQERGISYITQELAS